MIHTLHVLENVTTAAFLAFVLCLHFVAIFYSQGSPDSCSPFWDNCVRRWKEGANKRNWRENPGRQLDNPPSPSTGARGAPARGRCLSF